MINQPMKGEEAVLEKLRFPILGTPKIDGFRCIKKDGRMVSSTFKDFPNMALNKIFSYLPDWVDGELFDPKGFLATQSIVMTEWEFLGDVTYYIFDYVRESKDKPYSLRVKDYLDLDLASGLRVKFIDPVLISNLEQLAEYEEACVSAGFEGIVLRDPEGPYKFGKSTVKQGWMLKLKRFHDAEATIIGFEEMMENTNELQRDNFGLAKRSSHQENKLPKGMLGKFLVRDSEGREFKVGTGLGLTFELRQEIWDHQEKYLGKEITYKYQYMSEYNIPRHPIMKAFREGY